jgi:hypothetical protein
MKRSHAITPTDSTPPPNPDWRYSPPRVSRSGRIVEIDAMQLTWATEHQRYADERNKKLRGWGSGR